MSKIKPRLGRGLSSLMSLSELPIQETVGDQMENLSGDTLRKILELDLAAIVANPHQPRRTFDEPALADLAASIKSTGVIQPIIVRDLSGGRYELIAGERRWRAAHLAGLSTLPAIVRKVDSVIQAQMALIENIQREDLNPMERAGAYRELVTKLGLTHNELAGRLGEDRTSITHFVRLLDLPESVQAMVRNGTLSMAHSKLLMAMTDPAEQERIAAMAVSQSLSVRNLERVLAASSTSPSEGTGPVRPSAHVQGLEKTIARQLGMRVQIRAGAKKGKGRLVVHYASLDQFDALMTKLGISTDE